MGLFSRLLRFSPAWVGLLAGSALMRCDHPEPVASGPIEIPQLWRAWESQGPFLELKEAGSARIVEYFKEENSCTRYRCASESSDTCYKSSFNFPVLKGDSILVLANEWDIDYKVRIRTLTSARLIYAFRDVEFKFIPNTRVLVDTTGGVRKVDHVP